MHDLTAILLCGGKGERLRPFTDHSPKPLVPLAGRPILQYLIEQLEAGGLQHFVVCTGYKSAAIESFLDQQVRPRRPVRTVDSGEDAGITDRIRDARKHCLGPALVCYGDTLANVSIPALQARHREAGTAATVTVHPLRSPFGIVDFDSQGRVTAFREKPLLPYWLNIGFLLLEPAALALLSEDLDMVGYLSHLTATRQLSVYRHEGRHLTVNDEKERVAAEAEVVHLFNV